ncbi:MAG: cytochrome-c peroxidase [Bryobacteraceae bacterium]|nr:cytochrome-c peroxidase [Bryobacterales bacterium]NUN01688.1 cytochrome-c peroxidase [Bryobacteraceae bacterium]
MLRPAFLLLCALLALVGGSVSCSKDSGTIDASDLRPFRPIPDALPAKSNPATEAKVTLGRLLYYEPRLSKSQTISCNTCHNLDAYGVDGEPTSDGHMGQQGDRNSPTVYNAAGHFVQFWDGRAPDVEEQAKGPILNPVEMAMDSEDDVVTVLRSIPEYVEAFKRAFPDEKNPVTFDNAARAIGAFERGLVTPSRWDRFLRGDRQALTSEEQAGFKTFISVGCQACHMGAFVGGSIYQKLGVYDPWPDSKDPGRYKVTQNEGDWMIFKVASLRNVEKTAPYFHNGKVQTLEEAVSLMADHQLGRKLKESEVKAILAWLKTLTGEIPAEYIKPPALPASTSATPPPNWRLHTAD